MDRIQQEFRTNKEAQVKVRLVVVALLVIALALTYWIWPSHNGSTVLAVVRMSGAGAVLLSTLLFIRMLLTE